MSFHRIIRHRPKTMPEVPPVRISVRDARVYLAISPALVKQCRWTTPMRLDIEIGDDEHDGMVRLSPSPTGYRLHDRGETKSRQLWVTAWAGLPQRIEPTPLAYTIEPIFRKPSALVLTLPQREERQ